MRDRMERFVLLPFTVGCISESSIPVVTKHAKRSKLDMNSTPTRMHGVEKVELEDYLDDEESLSGENMKAAVPRFQRLFKNFSQLFVYKDEFEPDMAMEIGFPTDVKHVTHIGSDGCASSIFTKGWNDLTESELMNLHSIPFTQLELAFKTQAETPNVRSLLETKRNLHDNAITE